MSFLLDTDTCSAYLKNVRAVQNRFLQHGGLRMSAVTLAELGVWVRRRTTPKQFRSGYLSFRQNVEVLGLSRGIAREAGKIGAELFDRGHSMKLSDLLIATTSVYHGLTLVTHNTQDFLHVPGLTMTDWLGP